MDPVSIPAYTEQAVKNLWPDLREEPEFAIYFSDAYVPPKCPPKDYFFQVLNHKYPEYLQQILRFAARQRMTTDGEEVKEESVLVTDAWLEELREMPFKSDKCRLFFPGQFRLADFSRGSP